MRTLPAALALAAAATVLAGCGDNVSWEGDPVERADPEVVEIVTGSAAGGSVEEMVTVFRGPKDLDRYVEQFGTELGESTIRFEIGTAYRRYDEDPDTHVGAAVISVGCDVPPSATITEGEQDDTWLVHPAKVKDPVEACAVAITAVAIVTVPVPLS
ncbi:hypothetical protein HNR19_000702 [Nocardioides thalensis]|uniref:Lipoprotein n=1 Tax=Nocardioides thalensis TaxID=1914755 RepID=A0A853BY72_9ACTN|nr:hypothetical protein [Nocardioides thalensis]NYJ00004.1 hypothetical protein [Nocardioides thalensis]